MTKEISIDSVIDLVTDPKELPRSIFNVFFHGSTTMFNNEPLKVKTVTLSSGQGTIKKVKVGDFLYLEQNPYKDSFHGRLAAAGIGVMWVIYDSDKGPFKKGQYLLKVTSDKVERLV